MQDKIEEIIETEKLSSLQTTDGYNTKNNSINKSKDPLPKQLQTTIRSRVQYDFLFCVFNFFICFGIHLCLILNFAQTYFEVCI